MTVVALGARASNVALPTGQIKRVIGGSPDGAAVWPPDSAYFWADSSLTRPMQLPFTIAETCFLCARVWLIQQSTGAWVNGAVMLRLTDGVGTEVNDVNLHSRSYAYGTTENHASGGGWNQLVLETAFYVNPGSYFVQALSGGGGHYYYCSSGHSGMVGWTLGEGVT